MFLCGKHPVGSVTKTSRLLGTGTQTAALLAEEMRTPKDSGVFNKKRFRKKKPSIKQRLINPLFRKANRLLIRRFDSFLDEFFWVQLEPEEPEG